ncbi:MAG TPA: DUF2203 domain-containing protein [Verrucomicrobiota bacterium]|jgi:hypothetical protein|nr:DUF2203 domain-containing protein [Verrucomicrobiota bacterium]OQC25000.1 MAG: hypothetical protein BWX68_01800 [Verrucomicrobia bacterium ADurb.Bin063]HCL92217.1 DUF2203 domain-containing protein [Limisphaerales bacterium]HRR65651.1 DUF2203 domain-containing protein [Candidatus Paceibacterota bacterium]MBP8015467.1 DUF2203 domain-containing protein [Verrucomicrobiota bacterium]
MPYRFKKHYTREEARELLPLIRQWLQQMAQRRAELEKVERRLGGLMAPGSDLGGGLVNTWVRTLVALNELLLEFARREIQLKSLDRGLVDFPAIIDGREVFLCWEQDEEDVEFWHELDGGYAGRERV